jgi:hypothetical protein
VPAFRDGSRNVAPRHVRSGASRSSAVNNSASPCSPPLPDPPAGAPRAALRRCMREAGRSEWLTPFARRVTTQLQCRLIWGEAHVTPELQSRPPGKPHPSRVCARNAHLRRCAPWHRRGARSGSPRGPGHGDRAVQGAGQTAPRAPSSRFAVASPRGPLLLAARSGYDCVARLASEHFSCQTRLTKGISTAC